MVELTLQSLRNTWSSGGGYMPSADCWSRVDAAADCVARMVAAGDSVYGVNTGFGLLAQTRIADDKLAELQRNLIVSHAAGVGPALDDRVVRLILIMKAVSLARGHSGVRRVIIERLLQLEMLKAYPLVPAQGSVGASGDLAPLAHVAGALMGEGRMSIHGEVMTAADAHVRLDLTPLELGPKEGLALINGTQVSTALALDALFKAEHAFAAALVAGAMSVDALKGSFAPFDARIHAARGQVGQIEVAAALRTLLDGSAINASHAGCDKVQDPYSLRCQPQVMGACLDVLRQSAATLAIEANAVTDNPLIFPDADEAISGGNFHAEPVAFAADQIAMATAEIASISERRLALLVDPKMSDLPAFLVADSGLNSGFMIAQVTAAALVSENKTLAHPASVDSIPTSANQEDHVSMATFAGRKAGDVAVNASTVAAIELLAAAQGVDFHRPTKTSPRLQELHDRLRSGVSHYDADRWMADDIEAARQFVLGADCLAAIGGMTPSSAGAR